MAEQQTLSYAEQPLLKSVDVEEFKRIRKIIKDRVTTSVNRLENLFAEHEGNDFDHKVFRKNEIEQIEAELEDNFDMFLKLQDNYCYVRVQGKDDAEELKLAEKDVEYLEEVSSKVYPPIDSA